VARYCYSSSCALAAEQPIAQEYLEKGERRRGILDQELTQTGSGSGKHPRRGSWREDNRELFPGRGRAQDPVAPFEEADMARLETHELE